MEMFALAWWLWLLLGFVLLGLELSTPGGFYIFFFGVGAVVVGILSGIGLGGPAWLQWLLFGAISCISLALFRKPLQRRTAVLMNREVDSMVGEFAVAMGEIGVEQEGKAELRGTAWNARNVGQSSIATGQRCRVEGVEGLRLDIRA